ncbi:MAG: alpha/beta hydrolase [Bacilli bacterium]|nr:alpha/beta hydrolase [Bacilli bacterium]
MLIKINDVNINYIRYGKKEAKTLVFLHGWGQNIEMMQPVAQPFSDTHDIIVIDLPGYGLSEEPKFDWQVNDYVECIHNLLMKLEVINPILIGHSFGGKISLLYATKYEVNKLILFASPYKKEIKNETFKMKTLKFLKKVPVVNKLENFAKKHIGSTDYKQASVMMRKILVNTVNLDIKDELYKISCPTIIIWGTNDEAVNIEDAYQLEKIIPDAGLVVYENCTHYAYLEKLNQTINIMKSFLN